MVVMIKSGSGGGKQNIYERRQVGFAVSVKRSEQVRSARRRGMALAHGGCGGANRRSGVAVWLS